MHAAGIAQSEGLIIDVAPDRLVIADDPDRQAITQDRGVDHQLDGVARRAAGRQRPLRRQASIDAVQVRRAADHLDDAAHRTGAVQRPLRPTQDLDPFDVGQTQRRVGRVVGQAHIVEIEPDQALRLSRNGSVRQAANEELVAPRPQIGDRQARDARGNAVEVANPGPFKRHPIQRRQAVGGARQQQIVRA